MTTKRKKLKITSHLKNTNTFFLVLTVGMNIIIAFLTGSDKTKYTLTSLFFNSILLFWYNTVMLKKAEQHLNDIKKETMYINYPLRIGLFFVFHAILLTASFVTLSVMAPVSANATLTFTFFMGIISMIMPSVLFIVAIYFFYPAVIIPGYTEKSIKNNFSKRLSVILLALLLIFGFLRLVQNSYKKTTLMRSEKFKAAVMNVGFSTDFLKINPDISEYAKKLMARDTVNTPFLYTEDNFSFETKEDAEIFCGSIGARLPNYLEMYHIIFNKFETFGNKYYLTKDKDGDKNIVVHFKNMAYTVERAPKGITPSVYCVSDADSGYKYHNATYLLKNSQDDTQNSLSAQKFDVSKLKNIVNTKKTDNMSEFFNMTSEINNEKKHVSFSVKEVSPEIFSKLVDSGYNYNRSSKLSSAYETNDMMLKGKLNKDKTGNNEIRLCYFPFTDYSGVSRNEEEQIWSRSFCSPAFVLLNNMPENKTYAEAVSYCSAKGGRLPNIPELYGILKTYDINIQNAKYWTNTKVVSSSQNGTEYVKAINKDGRFMKVMTVSEVSVETANTYCIKQPSKTSRVIANYSSRFKGATASQYANKLCPQCTLYEVPDVIMQ